MKETKSVKQRPLMYITQPNLQPTDVFMQTTVISKREPLVLEPEQKEMDEVIEEEQPEQIRKEPERRESKKTKADRRKRFIELSIEEKINFFIKLPMNVPRSTCEIITLDEKIHGKITELSKGQVTISTFNEPYKVELPIESIQSIDIISL
ncbi:CotO family spore coat protein [Bacillus sp. AK128]